MNLRALESLRAAGPDCPSDLLLDGLASGDLERDEAERIAAHCSSCDDCSGRLKAFRRGFAMMPEYDERAALRRLLEASEQGPASTTRRLSWSNLRGLLVAGPALAAAAALVLVLSKRGDEGSDTVQGPLGPQDTTRLKGNLKLSVVRKTGQNGDNGEGSSGNSEEVISGEPIAPDATLRFRVTLPRPGRVSVVGVEASGTLYTAWPLPEHAADPVLPQCEQKLLPGAIALDGKPGKEMLHLVLCESSVEPSCVSRGQAEAPQCAAGCVSTPFSINKQQP